MDFLSYFHPHSKIRLGFFNIFASFPQGNRNCFECILELHFSDLQFSWLISHYKPTFIITGPQGGCPQHRCRSHKRKILEERWQSCDKNAHSLCQCRLRTILVRFFERQTLNLSRLLSTVKLPNRRPISVRRKHPGPVFILCTRPTTWILGCKQGSLITDILTPITNVLMHVYTKPRKLDKERFST